MKYLIKYAGCNIPEVTGLPTFEDYPRCIGVPEEMRFTRERERINNEKNSKYRKMLEMEGGKCLKACNKYIYKFKQNKTFSSYFSKVNRSSLTLSMSKEAQPFMKVQEQLDLTPDMLISLIGGIVGIFLGYSCLSLLDLVEFLLRKTFTLKLKE